MGIAKVIENNPAEEQAQNQFVSELVHLLESKPIDDGYTHPAEQVVKNALNQQTIAAQHWIENLYDREAFVRSWLAADLLRIIGRIKPNWVAEWGYNLIEKGLQHPDEIVRDSAARALEAWEGQQAVALLKIYVEKEPVKWLADYMRDVITDLAE